MKYRILIIAIFAFSGIKAQVYFDNNEVNKNCSALGETNVSSGNSSFVSGINSSATGSYSHAFGQAVEASNNSAFAIGAYNTASGAASMVIGSRSVATGTGAIAIGNKVNATFPFSYVIGMGTTSQSLINNIGNSLMIGFNSTKPTFFVSQNETMQTDGLGKIGIGTITPGSLLQVNGSTALGYDAATIAPANGLLISGNTGMGTSTVGSKLQINGNTAIGYSVSTAAPANGLLISGNTGMGTSTVGSKLQINGNAAIGYSSSTAAPANGLLISGNVGIGTTSATTTEKLTINGKIKTTAIVLPDGEINSVNALNQWAVSGSNIYRMDGNVGIGTNNPTFPLMVKKDIQGYSYIASDNQYVNAVAGVGSGFAVTEGGTVCWYLRGERDGTGRFNIGNTNGNHLSIASNGNIGIGTTDPGTYKLAVNGTIHAKEVIIDLNNWPDYVFGDNYKLRSLAEVEQHINQYKHLPDVPSAAEVDQNGVNLGEINKILLQKVEELTLYLIEQKKEMQALNARIEFLEENNK